MHLLLSEQKTKLHPDLFIAFVALKSNMAFHEYKAVSSSHFIHMHKVYHKHIEAIYKNEKRQLL